MMKKLFWISLCLWTLAACSGGNGADTDKVDDVEVANPNAEAEAQNDRRQSNRQRQYYLQGRDLYVANCSNCHGAGGKGLSALYPPLKDSDYLPGNEAKVACGIKQGMQGPMTVNGTEYDQMMAGLGHLTNLEIAEIMTYIYTEFGPERTLIDVKTVDDYLANCEEGMVTHGE